MAKGKHPNGKKGLSKRVRRLNAERKAVREEVTQSIMEAAVAEGHTVQIISVRSK